MSQISSALDGDIVAVSRVITVTRWALAQRRPGSVMVTLLSGPWPGCRKTISTVAAIAAHTARPAQNAYWSRIFSRTGRVRLSLFAHEKASRVFSIDRERARACQFRAPSAGRRDEMSPGPGAAVTCP